MDYRLRSYLDNAFWAFRLEERSQDLYLLPFAGLDTAGHDCREMEEYDLLCLDYSLAGEPSVVAWQFEPAWSDKGAQAVVELVSPSFVGFLLQLHRCPAGMKRNEPAGF
jgi:hypothetical protein